MNMNSRFLRRSASLAVWLAALTCCAAAAQPGAEKVLVTVADVPMPGPAVRFDYQALDPSSGRLYIAHMNADQLVVFDMAKRQVVANLDGFRRVHGVAIAPELHRVYGSVTGNHAVVAVDAGTLKTLGSAGPIDYPDGLVYAPKQNKVFVSDEHGGVDAVIDAATNQLVTRIPLGGGAGNTVYDPVSGHILVAVHGLNQLVVIDPATNTILRRTSLAGIQNPHGIALDVAEQVAFVAGEENHTLGLVDLRTMQLLATYPVGDDPDVLAYDAGLKRLYVSAESGDVTVLHFDSARRRLVALGSFAMPHAHTVAVDETTHLVYFPLENVDGHPILRIMRPIQSH